MCASQDTPYSSGELYVTGGQSWATGAVALFQVVQEAPMLTWRRRSPLVAALMGCTRSVGGTYRTAAVVCLPWCYGTARGNA